MWETISDYRLKQEKEQKKSAGHTKSVFNGEFSFKSIKKPKQAYRILSNYA